jgi:transposase
MSKDWSLEDCAEVIASAAHKAAMWRRLAQRRLTHHKKTAYFISALHTESWDRLFVVEKMPQAF